MFDIQKIQNVKRHIQVNKGVGRKFRKKVVAILSSLVIGFLPPFATIANAASGGESVSRKVRPFLVNRRMVQ
ncbi:hypothetical protein GN278_12235 [Rhodobacteraceae bacterium Araon29]